MVRLVELVAPRTGADAVLKALAFLVLINAFNFVVITWVRGAPFHPVGDLLNTTVVATPFVAFIMAILHHQRRLQGQLTWLATTDMLTGLPNRRAFLARAAEATAGGREGALLLLDADHFKRVNDRWGHAVGDLCLQAIAERLQGAIAPGDLVGRLGGEEFGMFLPGATRERAAGLGEALCRGVTVRAGGGAGGAPLGVTLSVGAALGGGPVPLARLVARADAALYRAKADGRARVAFWSEALDAPKEPGSRAA